MLAHVDQGSGPPVLLLHGGALDHRLWEPQIPELSRTHRVVAPDLRGHGASETPTAPFRHVDDVAALVRDLDLAPVTVAGISLGATVAVDLALEAPELVAQLVVSGAGAGGAEFRDPATLDLLARWAAAEQARDRARWTETFLELGFGVGRSFDDVAPDVLAHVRRMTDDTLDHHVPDGMPVLPTPVADAAARARELTLPVLAIVGLLDSPDHQRMAREVADRVVEVPGAGHYPNLERPDVVTGALLASLRA
ncbi:pimeloyl-ACP methyl ester carboxylesterase [Actinomycetospora succinea]|uniref:Pimeloyl-ACP methyl ester carboxylesterase n=1 Tax=Actinomycetospora succinea TaxID=663603 RepID=A0A4R6VR90_9PSEU|nr:alpha/beta fold hydrolase [Actinomycetospora succinea]TDQ65077.1 pimeloyl-ACP methyl ester carboxylesterase [Actinomycetospora succinea]